MKPAEDIWAGSENWSATDGNAPGAISPKQINWLAFPWHAVRELARKPTKE
jgi:hypothetical protein